MKCFFTAMAFGLLGLAGCGDDDATGPQFGDLSFEPSFTDIDSRRDATLELTNIGSVQFESIVLAQDPVHSSTDINLFCNGVQVGITPSSISSLAPGDGAQVEVSLDLTNATPDDCPPDSYDLTVGAVVNDRILAFGTIRFDWSGTPP